MHNISLFFLKMLLVASGAQSLLGSESNSSDYLNKRRLDQNDQESGATTETDSDTQEAKRSKVATVDHGRYKCSWERCTFASAWSGNLRRHMSTHTGEKPFKCDLCNYAFSQKSCLMRHRDIHTGEKKFKCEYIGCNYAAVRKGGLDSHMRYRHNDRENVLTGNQEITVPDNQSSAASTSATPRQAQIISEEPLQSLLAAIEAITAKASSVNGKN